MNRATSSGLLLPLLSACLACSATAENLGFKLELNAVGSNVRVSWPSRLTNSTGQVFVPEFRLERSTDLENWRQVSTPIRAVTGLTGATFSYNFNEPNAVFYRVAANYEPPMLGDGGGEVFGYTGALDAELQKIGFMDLQTFLESYAEPEWLPRVDFDPTTAQYWAKFQASSFALNAGELALFRTNGFVVSERLGAPSVGDVYYKLWSADLPVFVTTDSILQAWHRSFDNMLMEVEELELATKLGKVLQYIHEDFWPFEFWMGTYIQQSAYDVDYFLTVARSLLAGGQLNTVLGAPDANTRVQKTLADINAYQPKWVPLFGTDRFVDFSQFRPRGHYTKSEALQRYFKAMMWCGQIDFRVATYPPNKEDDLRQLGAALVFAHIAYSWNSEGHPYDFSDWASLDNVLRGLFGQADSMTLPQAGGIVDRLKLYWVEQISGALVVSNIQQQLLKGELGVQTIPGYPLYSPLSREQLRLPRSFTFLGQRFTPDSWALSQVVFDRVLWSQDIPGAVIFNKVLRRKPSGLDVAFAVFGNNTAVPEIASRIQDGNGVLFRDGKPYQHNLAAVRRVIDSQNSTAWTEDMYSRWLTVLRSLSGPPTATNTGFPQAMRTRAWAMKDLNAQLAGWTQLRHDTLLYAKQSYTPPLACEYPSGFVEPRPEFFKRMRELAEFTKVKLTPILATGTTKVTNADYYWPYDPPETAFRTVDISQAHSNRLALLTRFASTMTTLEQLAAKELAQQPFSTNDVAFLKTMMDGKADYLNVRQYTGWYPQLFYTNVYSGYNFHKDAGCDYPDGLVTDVHTDVPDDIVGDPGAIIHEGVGNFNLLVIAVDNGPDKMVYAGPVLSHYEFEKPFATRMTDEEWKSVLYSGTRPALPTWTRSYLVPK